MATGDYALSSFNFLDLFDKGLVIAGLIDLNLMHPLKVALLCLRYLVYGWHIVGSVVVGIGYGSSLLGFFSFEAFRHENCYHPTKVQRNQIQRKV